MTRSHLLAVCILVASLSAGCVATTPTQHHEPTLSRDSLTTVDVASYAEKYGEHDAVWLRYDKTIERASVDLARFNVVERRYLLLDPENDTLTTFEVTVPEGRRLDTLQLKTISPAGSTRTFAREDLNVEREDHSTTYKMAYPRVTKGTVVQEVFQTATDRSVPQYQRSVRVYFDEALQFPNPADSVSFTFSYPKDAWSTNTKQIRKGEDRLLEQEYNLEQGEKLYTYEARSVGPVAEEPFSPFYKDMANYVTLEQEYAHAPSEADQSSWNDVADLFKEYAVDKDPLLSRSVRRTTNDVVNEEEGPREKVESIMEYINDNIEVDPQAGTADFDELIDQKRGAPHLVTGLAQAMLEKAGIQSNYLAVHSAQNGTFDRSFVTPHEVRLPALRTTVERDTLFLFPFLEDLPMNLIPKTYQGQPALVVNPGAMRASSEETSTGNSPNTYQASRTEEVSSAGTEAVFSTIPRTSGAENVTDVRYDLQIKPSGEIEVTEKKTLRGAEAYEMRRSLQDLTEKERRNRLKEFLTYTDGDVEWTSREVIRQEAFDKPLEIRLQYTIDNLVTLTPKEVLFQTSGLFSPLTGTKKRVDPDGRTNPIQIYFTQTLKKHIRIQYPASWRLQTTLEDVSFNNRFGSITGTYETDDNTLVVDQEVTLQRSKDDADGFPDLLRLIGSGSKLQIPTLIFQPAEAGGTH